MPQNEIWFLFIIGEKYKYMHFRLFLLALLFKILVDKWACLLPSLMPAENNFELKKNK